MATQEIRNDTNRLRRYKDNQVEILGMTKIIIEMNNTDEINSMDKNSTN